MNPFSGKTCETKGYSNQVLDIISKNFDDHKSDFEDLYSSNEVSSNKNVHLVDFCYNLLVKQNLLPFSHNWPKYAKSDEKAIEVLMKGQKLYNNGDFRKALHAYNEALCLSTNGSETMAWAYVNRAMIYCQERYYVFSIENLENAINCRYKNVGVFLQEKIDEIAKQIRVHVADESSPYIHEPCIEISGIKHPNVPFINENLTFSNGRHYGNHIKTNHGFLPGEIIANEKPFVKTLAPEAVYSHCFLCAKNNFYNLEPCSIATSVMFCSKECATLAYQSFYNIECNIVDVIQLNFPQLYHAAVITTLKGLVLFSSLKDLQAALSQVKTNALEQDYTNGNEDIAKLFGIYKLSTCKYLREVQPIFADCIVVAIIFHLFKFFTPMQKVFEEKENREIFVDLLMTFKDIADVNSFSLYDTPDQIVPHGRFLSPIMGLFNHSCFPNAVIIPGTQAVMVVHPIKNDGQIFLSYNG